MSTSPSSPSAASWYTLRDVSAYATATGLGGTGGGLRGNVSLESTVWPLLLTDPSSEKDVLNLIILNNLILISYYDLSLNFAMNDQLFTFC